MRKTEMRATTLVDVLMVLNDLPQDEIEQIEAFSGAQFDAENMAMQIMSMPCPKQTCYEKETGDPLGVAGFAQLGPTLFRTFMLVTNKAWADFGAEVSVLTRRGLKDFIKGHQHVRVETLCLASRDEARAWYERIGLKYESTLHGYGACGESAVLYTKTQGAKGI
jgi:hypothetical protein